ncbi:hypothetical protein OMCYN_01131 [cyanobiont of Ornithocercus magnificus]|nr:hypothetical protein OMCYN_01131 [cyanobiont of Ornithocercus magnificus]
MGSRDREQLRRQRLHELLIALIAQQSNLELLDPETPSLSTMANLNIAKDPARWLDRNRRIVLQYRALVRTAVTLDALLDGEQDSTPGPG